MIAWASATLFRFDLPSAVQYGFASNFFTPGHRRPQHGARPGRKREGEGEQEGRELNYFVELEGEKVIDKVVPLHLAPSLAPSSLRRFAPGEEFSSVWSHRNTWGEKEEEEKGLSESHSCLLPLPTRLGLGGR